MLKSDSQESEQLLANEYETINSKFKNTLGQTQNIEKMMVESKEIYICEFGCALAKKTEINTSKTAKAKRQLFLAAILCSLFLVAEALGGYYAHSLALISDATHLLSDFAGLMISIFALYLTQKESTERLSFGYHRAEIIGALFSVFLIWAITIWLVYEAINRIITPEDINGEVMFIVAACGVVVNLTMGFILYQGGVHNHGLHGHDHDHDHDHDDHDDHESDEEAPSEHNHNHDEHDEHDDHNHDHGHKHHEHDHKNINVRSAFVHVLGDLVQSIGVLIAAALIWYDGDTFQIADPICTLFFSVIVIFTTVSLVRDILDVLMESVPKNVDIAALKNRLQEIEHVGQVHDLHIWNLSVGKPALSVHIIVNKNWMNSESNLENKPNLSMTNSLTKNDVLLSFTLDSILRKAQNICRDEFGIHHSTIQLEWPQLHDKNYISSFTNLQQITDSKNQFSSSDNHDHKKHHHGHKHSKSGSSHGHHDHDHDHDEHHDHDHDHDHNSHDEHGHDHDDEHEHKHEEKQHKHEHKNENKHKHKHKHDDNDDNDEHDHSDHSDHSNHGDSD